MCEKYNGWSNRETWAVALWLNNEEGMQESVLDALRSETERQAEKYDDTFRLSANAAGDVVQAWVEDLFDCENYGGSLPGSLVNMLADIGSLYRIDWREVGESFVETLAEGN